MLHSVFKFINKNKHKSKLLTLLAHNYWTAWAWNHLKFHWYTKPTHDFSKSINFFAQNANRIQVLTNMLADEKSKKIYTEIIKYRQTWNRKDFPLQYCDKNQYFINEIKAKLSNEEVFIDCGAFTGDTIDDFLKHCPKYKQIISFEPDAKNFNKLQSKHRTTPNTTLINAGTWNNDGTVSFSGDYVSGTILAGGGRFSIPVKSIDNLNLDKVTFIKMDIEGAELEALKGAEKTILRDKPKLAICIYHNDEDMIDIPEYIHDLVPEYKLYIRHHDTRRSFAMCETVVYAIM